MTHKTETLMLVTVLGCVAVPKTSTAQAGASMVMVASAPTLETELSAVVQLLGKGIVSQLEELAHLGAMVTNIKNLLGTANELFALTRGIKRAYDTIRRYDMEDLKRDLWTGAKQAMPEIADMQEEIGLGIENHHTLQSGEFFSRYDTHDARMDRAITASVRVGIRGNIYRHMFSDVEGFREPTNDAPMYLHAAFARSGMLLDTIRKAAAEGAMAERAAKLMDEADKKGRVDLSIGASSMMAQQQTMSNTTALRNIAEAEVSQQERTKKADERMRREMADGMDGFWGSIGEQAP
jgi:hypothetical protein